MKTFLTILLLLAMTTATAKQKYYKWVDENGNIHYTQKKPENKKTTELSVTTAKAKSSPKAKSEEPVDVDTEGKSPEQIEVDRYNAETQAKVKELQNNANCKIAKKNLSTIQKTVRVRRKDPATGEYYRMGDEERMKMLANAKKAIKDFCK